MPARAATLGFRRLLREQRLDASPRSSRPSGVHMARKGRSATAGFAARSKAKRGDGHRVGSEQARVCRDGTKCRWFV
jgi:hypothetical protein